MDRHEIGCFDDAVIGEWYEKECPNEDDVCVLDIEVDWWQEGSQTVFIKRACGSSNDIIETQCKGNYDIVPIPPSLFKGKLIIFD